MSDSPQASSKEMPDGGEKKVRTEQATNIAAGGATATSRSSRRRHSISITLPHADFNPLYPYQDSYIEQMKVKATTCLIRNKREHEIKSKASASVLTLSELCKDDYRAHEPSEVVALENIKHWPEYYTELITSDSKSLKNRLKSLFHLDLHLPVLRRTNSRKDETKARSQFEVNESLNQRISLWCGNITTLKVDAIVNFVGLNLDILGDVGKDIHLAAGPELTKFCSSLKPSHICETVITEGFWLPSKFIIQIVSPCPTNSKELKKCYRSCLEKTQDNNIRTMAFSCLGTQFCGNDDIDAAQVAVSTTREWLLERDNMSSIDRIIFCMNADGKDNLYTKNLKIYFPVEHPKTVPHDINLDPHALTLYQMAIKDGKEKDKVIRVNIVGNFRQGKTSLKQRLARKSVEGVTSTNGIDVDRCKFKQSGNGRLCSYEEKEGQEIVSRLVEVARNTDPMSLKDLCNPKLSGDIDRVLTTSYSDKDDLNVAQKSHIAEKESDSKEGQSLQSSEGYTSTNSYTRQSSNSPCGTPKRALTENEMISFTKDIKTTDSNKSTHAIVDFWDFGGQYVFYATHTMFHSKNAIYLLVFDLTVKPDDIVRDEEFPGETGDKNQEYFIRFWMNSIHSFVGIEDGSLPKVILVGTHKDKIEAESDDERNGICEAYFDNVRQMFEGTAVIKHIHDKDFAVNNVCSNDENISALLEEIIKIGDELSETIEIPGQWLQLERSLKEKRKSKIIRFVEIMEIDSTYEFPLSTEAQVKKFLRYHHCKGTLFYFDEEPMAQYVILDPQFLIDAFKCIITSDSFRKDLKKQSGFRESWKLLINDGKLENEVIDTVWKSDFIEYKDILLGFLKKFHVISEAIEFDEKSGTAKGLGWYIVPSLLKHHISTKEVVEFLSGKKQSKVRFVMQFQDSSLLQTIFSRLLAALLGKWLLLQPMKHRLFENLGMFRLDLAHVGLVEVRSLTIELLIVGLIQSKDIVSSVGDRFRRYCESVIKHEFDGLRRTTETVKRPYLHALRCNDTTHILDACQEVKVISEIVGNYVIPCPDLKNHDVFVMDAISEWFSKDQIDTSHLNKELTDPMLIDIAKGIGYKWQCLGTELGLSPVVIDHITADNNTELMRVFKMLKSWKDQNDCNSMSVLGNVLNRVKGEVRIDWDVIRNICDELHK